MTTKTQLPKFVQLRANRENDGHVEPAQHRGEVEFYSIYLGEPGDYRWVADFERPDEALDAVRFLTFGLGCSLDRSQFDEVLATPAK